MVEKEKERRDSRGEEGREEESQLRVKDGCTVMCVSLGAKQEILTLLGISWKASQKRWLWTVLGKKWPVEHLLWVLPGESHHVCYLGLTLGLMA